jgi:molecular chaperone GrpE
VAKNSQPADDSGNLTDQAIDEHLTDHRANPPASQQEGGQPKAPAEPSEDLSMLRKKAEERDEFLRLLQHVRADFANYQKRVQKEIDSTRRFAAQPLILDLLPVMDNLERALQAAETGGGANGLLDGIRMVHQQLSAALVRHGVQPVAAVGLPFNPEVHEALLEQPSPDKPERTVLQELQRGYSLHDRVIRPARVIVSSVGTPTPATPSSAQTNSSS